jgi:1,4-dihydroxy-2-naphthoate octaprenyltransferase
MEISPDKSQEIMTLAVYLGDGFTFVISGFFTMYTRDVYLFLQIFSIMTLVCVAILGVYLPESPRYLYSKREYDKLYSCFNQIAKMNKVKDEHLVDNLIESLKN